MRTRGYTIVELLVVLGLFVFLASFLIPTFQLILSQLELNNATDQVVDILRHAQQKTVTEQRIYGVTFTVNAATIPHFIYNPDTSKTPVTTYLLPESIIIGQVNFSGNADIRFSTSGAPNVSGNVVLKDIIRNKYKRVTLNPTGAITANQPEY